MTVKVKALSVTSKYCYIYIHFAVSNLMAFSLYLKAFNNAAHYFELTTGCDTVRNL